MVKQNIGSIYYRLLIIIFISLLSSELIFPTADSIDSKKTVEIIPGKEYQAGAFHKFLFGSLWRDLWTTPIKVEVLDLNSFAGGLTPFEEGGGTQTISLKLIGNDGKEYRFRSLNKDATKIVPEDVQSSLAKNIVKDLISTSNPLAPLISAPIANAVGILQPQPKLYVMPDDNKLGEFRRKFAGITGILEVHPNERENNKPGFAGLGKIIETYKLFENLEDDNDNKINATEYLKARLIDIFIGDWDRHVGQWRWAVYDENDFHVWYPVPKDRDQAFARFDGVLPFIASVVFRHLEGFSDEFNSIKDLTYSGRFIDRRLLVSIDKMEWDSVANFVIQKLTDSVIVNAVKKLPPEMFQKEGEKLIHDLKSRRDKLNEASQDFYKSLSAYVTIRGSNKHEYAEVTRVDDKTVEVNIFKKDGDTGKLEKNIFHRIFNCDETSEIRIMLLDGNDYALVKGKVNSSINVIISSGKGDDILIDSSKVSGSILGIIPDAENKTDFFISGGNTKIVNGPGTDIQKEKTIEIEDEEKKYEPAHPDYGHEWGWLPVLGLSSDEGLLIGLGRTLTKFGFNTKPFVYRFELSAAYATEPARVRVDFNSKFYSLFKNLIANFNFTVTGIEVLNFYGFGNQTIQNDSLHDMDYYDINQQQFNIMPFIELPIGYSAKLIFGTSLKYVQTEKEDKRVITDLNPYGIEDIFFHSFFAGFSFDTRNGIIAPTSGYFFNLGASYHPQYIASKPEFGKIKADVKTYFEFDFLETSSLALRAGAEKIWGIFPFSEASFLGGIESLRGFEDNRFAGDGFVHAASELRIFFTKFSFLVPVNLGFNTFMETGRVFLKNENSNRWHTSYGAGVLISLLKKDFTFNLSMAVSDEDIQYHLTTGFAF